MWAATERKAMKKILISAVAIIALTGCAVGDTGSSNSSNNNGNSTYTPAPPQNNVQSTDDIYVGLIRSEYRTLRNMSDYDLINFGKTLCSSIDDGLTLPGLALLAVKYGVDTEMLGFIAGAAVAAYCPYNRGFFDGY
jgi:hypothetical protein